MGYTMDPKKEKYPDLSHTNFPVEEDTFCLMTDVTSNLMSLVKQYNEYFDQGNMGACSSLVNNNHNLEACLFNAGKYNQIRDAVIALERFFLEDVTDLVNKVAQNTVGINDSPTPEQSSLAAYSAEKVEAMAKEINGRIDSANETLRDMKNIVTVPLPTENWEGEVAPFHQRVAVDGIKESDQPVLRLDTPSTMSAADVKLYTKLTSMITDGRTEDGYITFFCGVKKPGSDFSVKLEGVSCDE